MSCYDDYLDALAAAANKWDKAGNACGNLSRKAKDDFLQKASDVHATEVKEAVGDYCACLRAAGLDCE